MELEEYPLLSLQVVSSSKAKFSLRRSRLEIMMDILTCVRSGIEKPTQIMYKANLSWTALKEHIAALEESKLLKAVEYRSRTKYELTEKATEVLSAYGKIMADISASPKPAAPAF